MALFTFMIEQIELRRPTQGLAGVTQSVQRQPTALPARDKKDSLLIWSDTSEGQLARTNVTLGLIPALCRDTQAKQSDVCH